MIAIGLLGILWNVIFAIAAAFLGDFEMAMLFLIVAILITILMRLEKQ